MAAVQKTATQGLQTTIPDLKYVKPKSEDMNFEQVMKNTSIEKDQKATESGASVQDTQSKPAKTDASKKTEESETWKDKLANVQNTSNVKEEELTTEEDVMKAMETLITDIKNLILNAFEITPEELNIVMEEVGIQDLDLLNPQVLTDLTLNLTGNQDKMALLTDANLSEQLKGLLDMVESKKQNTYALLKMPEEQAVDVVREAFISTTKELPNPNKEKVEVSVQNLTENVSEEKPDETIPVSQGTEVASDPSKKDQTKGEFFKNSSNEENHFSTGMENSILSKLNQAVVNTNTMDIVEPEQVVRQLVERIKLTVNSDTTSFELQLEPEHLGKINLQVAAKNGVVTAQIAAETQAVKEVLESQVQILKENLENQGLKVEAVEVTIASHQFEQNLDNGSENQQEPDDRASKNRPLRFDVMGAEEEELSPEELITKEMMLANGNRINYMA